MFRLVLDLGESLFLGVPQEISRETESVFLGIVHQQLDPHNFLLEEMMQDTISSILKQKSEK